MEYNIKKPSNKLLALTDLDSNTWVSEVKGIRGRKQPLTAALCGLRFLLSAFPISAFQATRPRPRRRNPDPGAHPQRPGQPSLRPYPGGDRAHVANRAAPHAHLTVRNSERLSPGKQDTTVTEMNGVALLQNSGTDTRPYG